MTVSLPLRKITNLLLHGGDTISVDIGKRYTKVVQVVPQSDGTLYLKRAFVERTPVDIYTQTGIDVTIATEFLNTILSQNKVKSGSMICLLDKPYVMLKIIDLSKDEEQHAEDVIIERLKENMPFDLSNVKIDYHLYNVGFNKIKAVVGMAKKDVLSDIKKIARKMMVLVESVDVNVLSLLNAFIASVDPDINKTYVVVNAGYLNTDVVITKGWVPVFLRTLDYGIEGMIKMAGGYEAVSINDVESAIVSSKSIQKNKYMINILMDGIDLLIKKIENVVLDYGAESGVEQVPIESICVFGGAGYILRLTETDKIASQKYKIVIPNTFSFIDKTNSKTEDEMGFYPIYSSAVGAQIKLIASSRSKNVK